MKPFSDSIAGPPRSTAVVAAVVLIAGMTLLRLRYFPTAVLPIGYGVPLCLIAYFRNRPLIWIAAAVFTAITVIKFFVLAPPPSELGPVASALMIEADMLLVALIAHVWVSVHLAIERQNENLIAANAELAAREEEIARQNEELQSQTEELERQSEELRIGNEELERRERTLEALLTLSRSLGTEMDRGETMSRICQSVGLLVDEPQTAAAILEQHNGVLRISCHHGFGPDGPAQETVEVGRSFASLVFARGRTGYLEDVSKRPDLLIPQPRGGDRFVSVLAAPLRIGGWPVGTLEAYSRRKTAWSDQQIMLMESLAAQTSISMEAARLFETVQRERGRLEAVFRTAPIALVIANADCSDVRVNPAGAAMFQLPLDENVASDMGRGSWRLLSNGVELPPRQFPVFRAACEGLEINREELEQWTPEGARRVLLVNARPIRGDNGNSLGSVVALIDITPMKELQRELDNRRREAEEANVRKTRFLAAVSHDVRTPANAISLLAELLRRAATNPAMAADIPDLTTELHASSVSLVSLLTEVLDIARFDSGKVELIESDFSLNQLMEEERINLAPLARDKGLAFNWVLSPRPLWMRSDRIKLARVLGNLVGNAIKFTEKGEVSVEAIAKADGGVDLRVIDTGVGIALEHQAMIFDEFFQLRNPERDRTKGSGLGLSICHRLVEAMGAKLSVMSTPGKGSAFVVALPASSIVLRPPDFMPANTQSESPASSQAAS